MVERAEAIRVVKHLQCAYGQYAEFGLWNDLADLFASDGIGHYPAGDLKKEEIRKLFINDIGGGRLGLPEGLLYPHIMLQPVVILAPDGKSAKGRWRVFTMLGSHEKNANWAGGVYENEYTKEDRVWKIKDLRFYLQYSGSYEQPGWTIGKGDIPIHYTPDLAGAPVPLDTKPAASATMPDEKNVAQRLKALLKRAQRLNDQQDVENLQHIYGYYVDRRMWDDFSDLFALNGSREAPFVGVYIGLERIRKSLKVQYPFAGGRSTGFFACHQIIQPVIHVSEDGRNADIRVRLFQLSGADGENGLWMAGILEKKAMIENDIWKITAMYLDYTWTADYKGGWAKGPISLKLSAGEILETFPPDRPMRGPSEAPYPKIAEMPFHYVNPVSGRRPSLLLE